MGADDSTATDKWEYFRLNKRLTAFWRKLGYSTKRIFLELSFREYLETFLYDQYEKWLDTLRFQHAVTSGVQTGLFGKPPLTFETVFGGSSSSEQIDITRGKIPLDNFPRDIEHLSQQSVVALMERSRNKDDGQWDETRGKIAIGDNVLAARMARSDYLWQKWKYAEKHSQTVSVSTAKRWAEIEWTERALTPPGYFVDRCQKAGTDPKKEWQVLLGKQYHELQDNMFQLSLTS